MTVFRTESRNIYKVMGMLCSNTHWVHKCRQLRQWIRAQKYCSIIVLNAYSLPNNCIMPSTINDDEPVQQTRTIPYVINYYAYSCFRYSNDYIGFAVLTTACVRVSPPSSSSSSVNDSATGRAVPNPKRSSLSEIVLDPIGALGRTFI